MKFRKQALAMIQKIGDKCVNLNSNGILFSNNNIFQTISWRCSCVVGVSRSNGLERAIVNKRSPKFWIPLINDKQEFLSCYNMSIAESFISLIRGSFNL